MAKKIINIEIGKRIHIARERKRDISKAQYRIVKKMAKALGCIADDLVEDE